MKGTPGTTKPSGLFKRGLQWPLDTTLEEFEGSGPASLGFSFEEPLKSNLWHGVWHVSFLQRQEVEREGGGGLVSQCSATRDTVAATPPVARHDFMIYAWPAYGATPPPKGCDRVFFETL